MSDDIVERLRNQQAYDEWNMGVDEESVARDAADEIERLRAEVADLRSWIDSSKWAEPIAKDAEIERLRERVKALEGQNQRLQARLLVEAEAKGNHALAAHELRDALIRIAGFDHGRQVLSSVELARIAQRALDPSQQHQRKTTS